MSEDALDLADKILEKFWMTMSERRERKEKTCVKFYVLF